MRLVPNLEETHFHHDAREVRPLKDLFDVFHGQYIITKGAFGLDVATYSSADRGITGKNNHLDGPTLECSLTDIRVSNLHAQQQAARWTTVEVYKEHYYKRFAGFDKYSFQKGFNTRRLMLVAPDLRGAEAWAERPTASNFVLETHYDDSDLVNDTEVSVFIASGDTLLEAARTMVRSYHELVPVTELDESLSELNASMTVAHALGATSMECFEEIWNDTMELPDALTAARYAYRELSAE